MPNPYMGLMSPQQMEEEKLRQMAEGLRGRASTGGRLATSSLAPVQAQGRLMQTEATQQARDIGLQQYRALKDETDRINDKARADALSGVTGFSKVSNSAAEKFEKKAIDLSSVSSLIERFSDDYSGGLPGQQAASNLLSSAGMGSEAMDESNEWWGDWNKYYENVARHELFGSALTAAEQKAWRQSTITPSMDPEQIRSRLKTLGALNQKLASYMANNALNKRWDPTYVKGVMDVVLPEEAYGDLDTYRKTQDEISKRVTSNVVADKALEDMSLEELRALKAQMGM